jgi:hypothetical protein
MRTTVRVWVIGGMMAMAAPAGAQTPAQTGSPGAALPAPIFITPPPAPATLLEAFRPADGSVLTIGYDDLGEVAGIIVDVREMRDSRGARARGVVVTIGNRRGPHEQSYVDADELPELMKGFDALLGVGTNPTQFRNFEVTYATRGELILYASSTRARGVVYHVEVGRGYRVSSGPLSGGEIHQLRTLFEGASQKLATIPPGK